jgi:hypothetical protein
VGVHAREGAQGGRGSVHRRGCLRAGEGGHKGGGGCESTQEQAHKEEREARGRGSAREGVPMGEGPQGWEREGGGARACRNRCTRKRGREGRSAQGRGSVREGVPAGEGP